MTAVEAVSIERHCHFRLTRECEYSITTTNASNKHPSSTLLVELFGNSRTAAYSTACALYFSRRSEELDAVSNRKRTRNVDLHFEFDLLGAIVLHDRLHAESSKRSLRSSRHCGSRTPFAVGTPFFVPKALFRCVENFRTPRPGPPKPVSFWASPPLHRGGHFRSLPTLRVVSICRSLVFNAHMVMGICLPLPFNAEQLLGICLPFDFNTQLQLSIHLPLHFKAQLVLSLQVTIKDLCVVWAFVSVWCHLWHRLCCR